MRFFTESGSEYQVNKDTKQIRRVLNSNGIPATERQTNDWRTYEEISPIEIGNQAWICWPKSSTPLFTDSPDIATPMTITSRITKIE